MKWTGRFCFALGTVLYLVIAAFSVASAEPARTKPSPEVNLNLGGGTPLDPGDFPARTLHLPPRLALGELEFVQYSGSNWDHKPKAVKTVEALGNVAAPAGSILRLKVNWEASGDLARLECLKPNDVQLLDLSGARITDASLKHLQALTGLFVLSLRDTEISDEGISHLTMLKRLRALTLVRTTVTDSCFKYLAKFPDLEYLSLHSNSIGCGGFAALTALQKLRVIELQSTAVGDDCMKYLARLQDLRVARLDKTKVTDVGVRALAPLKRLRLLTLSHCKLTEASVPTLLTFNELKSLNVSRTGIDAGGAKLIEKTHPGIILRWGKQPSILEQDLAPSLLKMTTQHAKTAGD